jgi:putative restriction endonuclease
VPVAFADICVGGTYSRNDLVRLWGYAGVEAISRGVVTPREDNKIILFVTLDKRQDAEQYEDELVGSVLLWEGPNDHFAEERVISHRENNDEVHLFYRQQSREDFNYAGQLLIYCCQRLIDKPSRFVFRIRRDAKP